MFLLNIWRGCNITIQKAYQYTKTFQLKYNNFTPKIESGFYFIKLNDKYHLKNTNKSIDSTYFKITEELFNERYSDLIVALPIVDFLLENTNTIRINNYDKNKKIYSFPNNMALTSKGLISEETFYLAQDMMDNASFLKKKELVIDGIYLGLDGLEYIYIGDVTFGQDFYDQVYSLKKGRCRNRTSVKLVKHLRNLDQPLHGDHAPHVSESAFLYYIG